MAIVTLVLLIWLVVSIVAVNKFFKFLKKNAKEDAKEEIKEAITYSDVLNIAKKVKSDEEQVSKNKENILNSSKEIENMLSEPKPKKRRTKKNDNVAEQNS